MSTGEHSGLVDGLDGSTWVHVPVPPGESSMQLQSRTTKLPNCRKKTLAASDMRSKLRSNAVHHITSPPLTLCTQCCGGSSKGSDTLMRSTPDNGDEEGQGSSPVDGASVILDVQQEPKPVKDEAQIL